MRSLHYAFALNERLNRFRFEATPWQSLVETLSASPALAQDRDAWANGSPDQARYTFFCPAHFKPTDDPTAERNKIEYRRSNNNVLGRDLLVLDIDNDPSTGRPNLSIAEVTKAFSDFTFLLYTSYNHRNPLKGNVDKFRVVLPLQSYCPASEWLLRRNLMQVLWPFADPASFRLSQGFYLPVVHPDRVDAYQCIANEGKWLDWEVITPDRPAVATSARPSRSPETIPGSEEGHVPITLADGREVSAAHLYDELPEGYEHAIHCHSPFRHDAKPDCYVYRFGPDLCLGDNALPGSIRRIRIHAAENPQIVIDALADMARRKAVHLANLHTTPIPIKQPLIAYPEPSIITRLDSRYLNDFPRDTLPDKGLVFIKSPKGTGKTELLRKFVDHLPGSILLVGHRISLLSSLSERLGLSYYLTTKGRSERMAISLDSLTRFATQVGPTWKPYDTLFIDESEQVLRHLTAETLKKRRQDVVNVLIQIIRSAKRIVCLDADLTGELSVDLIALLRGEEQLRTDALVGYLNEYQASGRAIEIFPTRAQLLADLADRLASRQAVYITTNRRDFAEKLDLIIAKLWPGARTLVVSSRTRDDAKVKAFHEDPEKASAKFDVVIATPAMTTGTSIDIKGHFKAVYGFFDRQPYTFQDCDQAISRVREALPTKVWITSPETTGKAPKTDRYFAHIAMERERRTRIRLPDEEPEFTQGELLWFRIYGRLCRMTEIWSHNKLRQFVELKEDGGFQVEFVAKNPNQEQDGEDILQDIEHDAIALEIDAIMNARDITPLEQEEIDAKQVKTREEENALAKCRYKALLGDEAFTRENVREAYVKRHLEKRTRVRRALNPLEKSISDDQHERQSRRKVVTDYEHRTKEWELLFALCRAATLDYREMLARALMIYEASAKLKAASLNSEPRSPERQAAVAAYKTEIQGIDTTISKAQMLALAQHYAQHLGDYNLYFGSRIKDPTQEENQMKAWNATLGKFALPLKKTKKGPRGQQGVVYVVDCTDGLLIKAMEAELIAFQT